MRRELRTCPVTGVTVLVHAGWPEPVPPPAKRPGRCEMCAWTGPVIARIGGGLAVPHPVPALGIEGDVTMRREGGHVWREAVGAHELIFGEHDACPWAPVPARIEDLRRDHRFRGFRVFRRHISGRHVVWQLVALPTDVAFSAATAWRDAEVAAGTRVAVRDGGFAAVLAFAPRVAFETWVVPVSGREGFPSADGVRFAEAMRARLGRALREPTIDLVVEEGEPWRIVLMPQLQVSRAIDAVLPVVGAFPERAAEFLRGSELA